MTATHPLLKAIFDKDLTSVKVWLDTYGAPIIVNDHETKFADPRVVNSQWNYGLYHYALEWPQLINLLKQYKNIDIEHGDVAGRTALGTFFWCEPFPSYTTDILIDLLEAGANPNTQDIYGNTPMHWLMMNNSEYTLPRWYADQLMHHGADLTIKNISQQTPADIANQRNKHHWMKV